MGEKNSSESLSTGAEGPDIFSPGEGGPAKSNAHSFRKGTAQRCRGRKVASEKKRKKIKEDEGKENQVRPREEKKKIQEERAGCYFEVIASSGGGPNQKKDWRGGAGIFFHDKVPERKKAIYCYFPKKKKRIPKEGKTIAAGSRLKSSCGKGSDKNHIQPEKVGKDDFLGRERRPSRTDEISPSRISCRLVEQGQVLWWEN